MRRRPRRSGFDEAADAAAQRRRAALRRPELFGQIPRQQQNVGEAVANEIGDHHVEERPPADIDKRLGAMIGERPQARSPAADQDYGLHPFSAGEILQQRVFDQFANRMADGDVQLLNARRRERAH